MHFLLGSCLLTSPFFFFLVARTRASRAVRNDVYFPPPPRLRTTVPDSLAPFRGPRFGACEVSPPCRLSRGQVHFTRMRTLCCLEYVTARRHLCRGHPKEPTTPDPRGPLSPEEFEIARDRPYQPWWRGWGVASELSVIFLCVSLGELRVEWKSWMPYLEESRDATFTVYLCLFISVTSCPFNKIRIDLTLFQSR